MSTAIERIEKLSSEKDTHPFDFVFNNTAFYDPRPEEGTDYTARLRAQTKVAYVAANAVSRGLQFVFIPGAMSNGSLAYDLAQDYQDSILRHTEARTGTAYLTTQRLKHNVAGSELLNRVILPNRIRNHQWSDQAEMQRPGFAVVGPVDFEGPIRVLLSKHAMSLGTTFQDWTYESWWGPRVIDTSAMELRDDHAYSRYTHVEETIADLIQCGLLDHLRDHNGPGKKYDITDEKGRQVPLSDRAWETAKHIVDVTERGFRTDLAVAALIVRFQIDDWLNDPANSPLDMSRVHPALARRTEEDKARMAALKEIMLPYLAEKCMGWFPYESDRDLKAYVEKNVLPAGSSFDPAQIKAIQAQLFSYQPRGGYAHPVYGKGEESAAQTRGERLVDDFSVASRAVKRRGTDGDYFETRARLFEDNHYAKLDIWEQAALGFVLGAMEGHRLPEVAPRAAFYACEPKGGLRAKEWADKHGVEWLKEAQAVSDPVEDKDNFFKVMAANAREAARRQEQLSGTEALKRSHVQNVVSTLDMLQVDEAIQKYRDFVATPGPARLSERARLAMQMEWLDRNAEVLVLREGWQHHPTEVQLMLRAVLHATGQVDRPYEGGRHRMTIFVDEGKNSLKKQNLYDLVSTLGQAVEENLDRNQPPPDRASYVALARLLEIADKLADPGSRNYTHSRDPQTGATSREEIIKWQLVDGNFYKFWLDDPQKRADLTASKGEEESLRDRLRGKLLSSAIYTFEQSDLQGLDDDYARAWGEAHGVDLFEKRRHVPTDTRHLNWRRSAG